MLPVLLAALGLAKGLADAKQKEEDSRVSKLKGVADAWTGKDWSMKNVSPWESIVNPVVQGASGYASGEASDQSLAATKANTDMLGKYNEAQLSNIDSQRALAEAQRKAIEQRVANPNINGNQQPWVHNPWSGF